MRTKRRWTVLQEILSVLTSRGCFLNHLVDGSIRTSEDLLLHHFVEAGFFDFQTYQDLSGGYAQAITEMLQATMRNSIGLRSTPFASFSRPPLCNDIRLVETYPDSRNRRRPLLINARPATRTQK